MQMHFSNALEYMIVTRFSVTAIQFISVYFFTKLNIRDTAIEEESWKPDKTE